MEGHACLEKNGEEYQRGQERGEEDVTEECDGVAQDELQ